MDIQKRSGQVTVVRKSAWGTAAVYVVFALVGAGAGWLVGLLADWLLTLSWVPMQGPVRLAASLPDAVLPALGAAAGLVLGFIGQFEQLALSLSDDHVALACKGRTQEFAREAVATVFLEGKQLVLLGRDGRELAREDCELDAGLVAEAFSGHGYAWAAADPYRDEFRRWVPGTPGLPEGANAVLKARQKRLEKQGLSDDDVRELRAELARLGVVVKDEKRRQYWRVAGG